MPAIPQGLQVGVPAGATPLDPPEVFTYEILPLHHEFVEPPRGVSSSTVWGIRLLGTTTLPATDDDGCSAITGELTLTSLDAGIVNDTTELADFSFVSSGRLVEPSYRVNPCDDSALTDQGFRLLDRVQMTVGTTVKFYVAVDDYKVPTGIDYVIVGGLFGNPTQNPIVVEVP